MRVEMQPVVINGAHGEGGGALLRTALAMSALTQQPVRLHNVRGAMRKIGLNAEDLAYVQALTASCRADVEGDELESRELAFLPGSSPRPVDMRLDPNVFEKGGVSASVAVLAQALVPVFIRAGGYSRLVLLGETHGQNMLGYDTFERVTLAAHRAQGVYVFPSLSWAGYGPASKGEAVVEVEPSVPEPLVWESRGPLRSCSAVIALAEVSDDVGQRGARRIRSLLSARGVEAEVEIVRPRSRAPGVSVTLWAEFEDGLGSGTALGQRGLKMEAVVDNVVRSFDEWFDSDATVDAFLADQLLLVASQADGRTFYSTPRITRRLVTMSWVIKQFLPIHITIKGEEGYPGTVTVER